MRTIYPNIHVQRKGNKLRLSTTLIKKHRGKYYYWPHVQLNEVENRNDELIALNRLHREVYITLHLRSVNVNCVEEATGKPVFELAEKQIDEKQRLRRTYKTY